VFRPVSLYIWGMIISELCKFVFREDTMSTDQQMVPAMNAMDAHAQNIMANDDLFLPILKTFAHCTLSLDATRNACCFQCVCNSRNLYRYTSSRPVVPSTVRKSPPASRQTHPISLPRAYIISLSVAAFTFQTFHHLHKTVLHSGARVLKF
jgi:hypothetical protein